jgi:HEPN domain-containing protein
MREETRIWREQAEADLATAKSNLEQGIHYASVLFSQQAAEKILKARFIHSKKQSPPKTHNLVLLARELGATEEVIDACADLAPEYVLTRCPDGDIGPPSQRYTGRSAQRHLKLARKVMLWAKKGMA